MTAFQSVLRNLTHLRGLMFDPTRPPATFRPPARPATPPNPGRAGAGVPSGHPVPEGTARPRPSRPVNLLKAGLLPRCEHCQICNPVRPCDLCEAVAELIGQVRVLAARIVGQQEANARLRDALAFRLGVIA